MPFWNDPRIEPKRPWRFLVPFPVYIPRNASAALPVKISDWAGCGHDLIGPGSKFGVNNIFWFMATAAGKPGLKSTVSRTDHVANGYAPIRRNQTVEWEFDPISVSLVDTYDHDLEMSLTAMLFALGGIQQAPQTSWEFNGMGALGVGAQMVPMSNTLGDEFVIIELAPEAQITNDPRGRQTLQALGATADEATAAGPDPQLATFWARKIILKNPYLVSADFGSLDYNSTDISRVNVSIAYDSYDIEHILDRHTFDPSQFSERSMGELRRNQRAERLNTRADLLENPGMSRQDIGQQMSHLRTEQRDERQDFRSEEGHVDR